MMQGRRTAGWLRALPAFLIVLGASGIVSAPGAARAQEGPAQVEVTGVQQTDGGLVVTIITPAALAGSPTVSVDGAARAAAVTPARRPAVVLALETGSSMSFEQLTAARQAAAAFLRQLPPTTRVAVITFDNGVSTNGFAADAGAAQAAFENLVPNGVSALFDAVTTAATSLRDVERSSATLVLVTHGWDWGGASTSSRADSFAAVQALGGEVYPVIIGNDFDTTLLSGLANPVRTAPWSLDDLGSGRLAAAVAAGARVEQQVRLATSGLKAGDHEVTIGWDGPTPVTPVVRTFPVVAGGTNGASATVGDAAGSLGLTAAQSLRQRLVTIATVVAVPLLLFGAFWFMRHRRKASASKVSGRLVQLDDVQPTEPEAVRYTPPATSIASSAPLPVAPQSASTPNTSDQRAFERVQLGVVARLLPSDVDGAKPLSVLAFDISEGGLSFRSHTPITPGTQAYLNMELPPNGDEVQLHVLILNVVPVGDGETFSVHCSFIDITPRTLWRIVGACLALSGDTANAAELMNWGGRHALSADQLDGDALFEPVVAASTLIDAPSPAVETDEFAPDADGLETVTAAGTTAKLPRFAWEVDESEAGEASDSAAVDAGTGAPSAAAAVDTFVVNADAFELVAAVDALDGAQTTALAVDEVAADEAFGPVAAMDVAGDAPSAVFGVDEFVVNADKFELVVAVDVTADVPSTSHDEAEIAAEADEFESVAAVDDAPSVVFDEDEFAADVAMEPVAAVEATASDSGEGFDAVEFGTDAAFGAMAVEDRGDDAPDGDGPGVDGEAATTRDDRALSAAMQLARLLSESTAATVTAGVSRAAVRDDGADVDAAGAEDAASRAPHTEIEADEIEQSAGLDEQTPGPSLVAVRSEEMLETRSEVAVITPDDVRCSHCAGGVLELQRLVRQDDFLESWWLCMACTHITYRQQEPEAWLRTTSVPDSLGDPRTAVPATDFDAVLLRMRQEEATATARAAQLRDELARTEGVLRDIRMAHRLLERFSGDGEPPADAAPGQRAENEPPAA